MILFQQFSYADVFADKLKGFHSSKINLQWRTEMLFAGSHRKFVAANQKFIFSTRLTFDCDEEEEKP